MPKYIYFYVVNMLRSENLGVFYDLFNFNKLYRKKPKQSTVKNIYSNKKTASFFKDFGYKYYTPPLFFSYLIVVARKVRR